MILRTILATTALVAAPAIAQTSSAPSAAGQAMSPSGTQGGATTGATASGAVSQGATVYDPQGGTVGTVESVSGDMVVLATQKSKVQLPKSSFASGPKGPIIAMTSAQLDQAAAQANPAGSASGQAGATGSTGQSTGGTAGKASVTQGAAVTDTQGGAVGTVSEVDAQFATVTLTTGGKVRLPVSAFGAGANGGLRVAMSAAQLSAAAGASGGGSSSSSGADTSPTSGSTAKGKKGH